jgi:hypothetical protein
VFLIVPNASYLAVARRAFLAGQRAPADDRIQKGKANHSGSTKLGQLSAVTRTKRPCSFLRPAMG